jgi:Rps23 Pro-64 3,4-dihydroxylase Tpa1-like proline 4-hydroxylase
MLQIRALEKTKLESSPFEHVVVKDFIGIDAIKEINRDYPEIHDPKNFQIENLSFGPGFEQFLTELQSDEVREVVGQKFGVDLTGKPAQITVRRLCESNDGKIHTDSRTKIISALVYFNEEWPHEGGQLRLLRSDSDVEDYAVEVPPKAGTMLAFRRCDHSYHGHKPFDGERRMVQISWVEPKRVGNYKDKRTRLKWRIKRLFGMD